MQVFNCKQFQVEQSESVFKITTDATLLGALAARKGSDIFRILDVGCGTGIVSMMLAQRFPVAHIDAIDISEEAVQLTKRNFEKSPYTDRLSARCADILGFRPKQKYDLIVTNPPYFLRDTTSSDTNMKLARHMQSMTYTSLLQALHACVDSEKGIISVIHPVRYRDYFTSLSSLGTMSELLFRHNESSPVRNMITEVNFSKLEKSITCQYFNLRNEDNSFSSTYISCLKDFLTIF